MKFKSSERKAILLTFILFIVLSIMHLKISQRVDWPILFGNRTEAIFDFWMFQHFFSGILIGAILIRSGIKDNLTRFVYYILIIALVWEYSEFAMECGLLGEAVSDWKQGFEHWSNRLIGDPLLVLLGGSIVRKYNYLWRIVVIPALVWLLINILAPNSMTINQMIIELIN